MTDATSSTDPGPVTLANWRAPPFSERSFHRIETVIPVAPVPAGGRVRALAHAPREIGRLAFEDAAGREWTVAEALEASATRGLVVLRGGRVAAEWYGRGYDGTRPHLLFSVTKSVTGALAGVLADRGLLDPEAEVRRYVPEAAGAAFGDCTVRHLLDMSVSVGVAEDYDDPEGHYARFRAATLWNPPVRGGDPGTMHGFLATLPRGAGPHGRAFRYHSADTEMLGWVLERAAGRSFAELLSELIWRPMGAEAGAQVTVDAEGSARASGGLCALPRDLARFGEMMRRGGAGVVPGWWIEDIRTGGDRAAWRRGDFAYLFPEGGYRSQWYLTGHGSGAFTALGIHAQWLWIDPAREVVIAKVSALPVPYRDEIDLMLIRAFEALAAALAGARQV